MLYAEHLLSVYKQNQSLSPKHTLLIKEIIWYFLLD